MSSGVVGIFKKDFQQQLKQFEKNSRRKLNYLNIVWWIVLGLFDNGDFNDNDKLLLKLLTPATSLLNYLITNR